MKFVYNIFRTLLIGSTLVTLSLRAQSADEPLQIDFEAHRVTLDAEKKETLTSAETAFPGDLIQYTAVYSNLIDEPLTDVRPVIPVPRGMSLILESIDPEAADGSLDGVRFSPFPLKDALGEPVPVEAIRALRWHVPELSPDESVKITFRVHVDS